MVSGDVEDNLAFMARGQLGWTTGSYFTEGVVALSQLLKGLVGNVGDVADFKQGMSAPLDQPQGSASAFGCPLESLHGVVDELRKNWISI